MATLTAQKKRGFLGAIYRAQQKLGGAQTLREALEAYQDARFSPVQSGRLLVGSSGAGHAASFRVPGIQHELTEEAVFDLSQELLEIYDSAVSVLVTAGTASPTDPQIYTGMLADDRMQTIRDFMGDYTATRLPGYGYIS